MSEVGTFGRLLRQYRLAASLSQEALGERAGLSARAIAALERGRRTMPRPSTVLLLAEGLGLPPAERAALIGAARTPRAALPGVAEGDLPRVPVPLSSFVGRAQELADVRRLLGSVRLLTLTGAAGVGKTRLALEVAREATDEVAFVELAPLADGALVPHAVAAALDVREQPQQPLLQTLAAALQARPLLLVLDNCEHLLAACAELAGTLLRACAQVRLLATSREPLSTGGEVVWPVPALSLPDLQGPSSPERTSDAEAVRLFVERARAAQPSFALTEQNTRAVAEVCIQLDGLPLAIELAAARVRALAPAQIAARLGDRFRLLAGGSRGAPARHHSLQAAIDWSYDLLSRSEQQLLDRLSIFAGGWTLEAVEAVCAGEGIEPGDVVSLLSRLVDRSLVVAEPGVGGALRYRLLETLREYAAERLDRRGEREALSQRHRAWYVALGEQAQQDYWLRRRDLPGWWERLALEQANFRAALRFSLERGEVEPGFRLVTGIWVLWGFRGPWVEGTDWTMRLLAQPGCASSPAARADALTVAGQMAFEYGDVAAARDLLLEAVALQRRVGTPRGLAMALDHAGLVASARGEFAAAHPFHEEAVAVCRAAGNRGFEAVILESWSAGAYLQGEYELARTLAEASLAIVNALDADGPLAVDTNIPLYVLGRIALYNGDYAAARRHFQTNLAHWSGVGDARSRPAVGALVGLSCVAVVEGDLTQARDLLAEALALSEKLGAGAALAYALEGYAILATAMHQPEHAVRLAGAATALRAALHHPISPAEHAVLERWLGRARNLLSEEGAARAWKAGQDLSAGQAILCARTLHDG